MRSNPIEEVLTRSVERIYPSRQTLEDALKSGKKLRVYQGFDPTGKLHIGHSIGLRKLRQFQDLKHEVIVLIGDFTATIGDPSGRKETRRPLSKKEVLANVKGYKEQISKFLDLKKSNIRFLHNEEWTNKLKPADMLNLASQFTVAGLLERDMFQERIKAGRDIRVHEFLYPIFQAYDSVTMDVDLEIGGKDQIFNMLAGRTLVKKLKNKEKYVLALKLLVGPSGRKMGKTEGNLIALNEKPEEMYGKVMAWPDELIAPGLELLTDIPQEEIKKIIEQMKAKKLNPRKAKAKLAKEVVAACHNQKAAALAEQEFNRVFREKKEPSAMQKIQKRGKIPLVELLILPELKFACSKSEARRLIKQGGVKINRQTKKDPNTVVDLAPGVLIQVGKRRFAQVK